MTGSSELATEPRTTTPARPAGRPRNADIDTAVMDATRVLLLEVGYAQLSFERIAQRAGTTRQAIYRRWPTKAALVLDVLVGDEQPTGLPVPDTGDLAADLRTMLRRSFKIVDRPEVRAATLGLLADIARYRYGPRLTELLLRTRASLDQRLREAVRRGEIAEPDVEMVHSVIDGVVAHRISRGASLDRAAADRLAGFVFAALKGTDTG